MRLETPAECRYVLVGHPTRSRLSWLLSYWRECHGVGLFRYLGIRYS